MRFQRNPDIPYRVQNPRLLEVNILRTLRARIVPRKGHERNRIRRQKSDIEEEQEEIFLIPFPDAVVDPGAVMVHPPDAALARPAMVSPRRTVHFASRAHRPIFVYFVIVVLEVLILQQIFDLILIAEIFSVVSADFSRLFLDFVFSRVGKICTG